MAMLKSFTRLLIVILVVIAAAFFVFTQWSWVFSKRIDAEVLDVKRVTQPNAIISSRVTEAQLHSYSILLKGEDGVLYTTSSEDRQWEVVGKGYCVEARLYRYPPWDLEKAGTFFNARIKSIRQCAGGAPTLPAAPSEVPPAQEPAAPADTNQVPPAATPPPEVK